MKQQIIRIINDVYSDLQAVCEECGDSLDAETLADTVGDRMVDECPEYRAMPYAERRALVVSICKKFV